MTGGAPHLVHGMGLTPAPPDWPPLTEDELQRVVAHVPELSGSTGLDVVWHSPRPYSAAALVRVVGGDDLPRTVFVKRHHDAVRDPAALSEEHRYLRHLRAKGEPVPRVLGTKGRGGATAWQHGRFTYEVHEALDGIDLYREAPSWTPYLSAAHAGVAGQALGRLHLASEGYDAPARQPAPVLASWSLISSTDLISAVAAHSARRPGLASYLRTRQWKEDLSRHLVAQHERWRALGAEPDPLWTHNDWHPSNLLWSGKSEEAEVVGIIDFGLCNRTTAVYDLAMALERAAIGWLQPFSRRRVWLDHVSALLGGYRSARPLSPVEMEALPLVLPIVHVDYALSEVEYFHSVVGSAQNADLAYQGYLLSHARWFASAAGRGFLAYVAEALR